MWLRTLFLYFGTFANFNILLIYQFYLLRSKKPYPNGWNWGKTKSLVSIGLGLRPDKVRKKKKEKKKKERKV